MLKGIFVLFFLLFSGVSFGQVQADIRSSGILLDQNTQNYILWVDDCSGVASVETQISGSLQQITPSSDSQSNNSCQYQFTADENQYLSPSVNVNFKDGTTQLFTETFQKELVAPSIALSSVSVSEDGDEQILTISFIANDNIDLTYLGVDVTAFKASDLRSVGGIVEQVKSLAFASTSGYHRVYPISDEQVEFFINIPVIGELTQAEIANNALVLIDAYAIDASGNKSVVSSIETTGGNIEEKALSWRVFPEEVIITDVLQSVTITPSIQFEFRGETVVQGAGRGVSYISDKPSEIYVNSSGVVYLDTNVENTSGNIKLSYPGLPEITVPIRVDLSKKLARLAFKGFDEQDFVVPSLNKNYQLPQIEAVFDDNSRVPIADQYPILLQLPQEAEGILSLSGASVKAQKTVVANAPISLKVGVEGNSSIVGAINIVAKDALPKAELAVSSKVEVGQDISVSVTAEDDVAIHKVDILLNGSIISSILKAPYQLQLPITQDMYGQSLKFEAFAIDSAGQYSEASIKTVVVADKVELDISELKFEHPLDNQVVVASSPTKFQIAREVGPLKIAHNISLPKLSKIEFILDGDVAAEVLRPGFEVRDVETQSGTESYLYEVWSVELQSPESSLKETSRSLFAKVYSQGKVAETESRLIRLVQNKPTELLITHPHQAQTVIAGQAMRLIFTVTDDTLLHGTQIEAKINGESVFNNRIIDRDEQYKYTLNTPFILVDEVINIEGDLLGETLDLVVTASDYHGAITTSEIIQLSVKSDQPPTIAMTTPLEGANWVAGLPVELMASASDDVSVKQVDFYVNDIKIGTDVTPPYNVVYQTPTLEQGVQSVAVRAEALDSGGNYGTSQTVHVTLGFDEQLPVMHIVAPTVTGVVGDTAVASVVEGTDELIKISGYDNVGVTGFTLSGIRKTGSQYLLTGQDSDIVTDSDISIQNIPGGANAFSIVAYTRFPNYQGLNGAEADYYQISASVKDARGNESKSSLKIAITEDQKAKISDVKLNKKKFTAHDKINVSVIAQDDVAVEKIRIALHDANGESLFTREIDDSSGLTIAANTGAKFEIELQSLTIANQEQNLLLIAEAFDKSELSSEAFELPIQIVADNDGPIVGIEKPLIGSQLLNDVNQEAIWAVKDASLIKSASLNINGKLIDSVTDIEQGFSRTKTFQLSDEKNAVFEITAEDVFGNQTKNGWSYSVNDTSAPIVDILAPVSGDRLYEGEQFLASAKIDDDGYISEVVFAILVDDIITDSQVLTANSNEQTFEFSTSLRFPNAAGTSKVELQVSATDNHNQHGVSRIELVALDDVNPPLVNMLLPEEEKVLLPGEGFKVEGNALDDIYINKVYAVLIDDNDEEIELEWQSLAIENSIKTVSVPDPITIGSTIVKEQFFSEVTGFPLLVSELWGSEDKSYQLVLRAEDNGINVSSSLSMPISFRSDINAPSINVLSPINEVVEHQIVPFSATIEDDVNVEAYKIYFPGNENNPIIEAQNINQKFVQIESDGITSPLNIDLSMFAPIEASGKNISIIIDAWDHKGNKSSISHNFKIIPDTPAEISITGQLPEPKVNGGIYFYQTELVDDFASAEEPTLSASIATSFSLQEQNRQAWYSRYSGTDIDSKSDDTLRLGFSYAEAVEGWSIKINGKTYFQFTPGELEIQPLEINLNDRIELNKENSQSDIELSVRYLTNNQCPQLWQQKTVNASEGFNIRELFPYGTTEAIITPLYSDGSEHPYIKSIRLDLEKQDDVDLFPGQLEFFSVQREDVRLSIELKDLSKSNSRSWISLSRLNKSTGDNTNHVYLNHGEIGILPLSHVSNDFDIYAMAVDRNFTTIDREPMVNPLRVAISEDVEFPEIEINEPSITSTIIPGQVVRLNASVTDNAAHLRQLSIYLNDKKLSEQGSLLLQNQQELLLPIDKDLSVGSIATLRVVAEDPSGNESEHSIELPVSRNNVPEINWLKFVSHREINDLTRLNYGEFWVRQGSTFNLDYLITDDSGLQELQLVRLLEDGLEFIEASINYEHDCNVLPTIKDIAQLAVSFQYAKTQQYELRVIDNVGQQSQLRFYVHPLANIVPGIRISQPAQDQYIAAGSFNLKARVIMTDDMPLDKSKVKIAIDGIELAAVPKEDLSSELTEIDLQLLEEIYDDFEHNYGLNIAEDYARSDANNILIAEYIVAVPIEVIGANQNVTLTAEIIDRDQAIGSDEIQFVGAEDEIKPQAAILSPIGTALVTEASTLPIEFRGFDNVKVAELSLKTAYGIKTTEGYSKQQYGASIRTINAIPARDFEAITLSNIDTPIYSHLVTIPKINEIYHHFSDVLVDDSNRFDLWVKLTAKDHAGNEYQIEQSYNIRVDERPIVDIVTPTNLERVVSGSKLAVNVHAYDDVGIHYVNLKVTQGDKEIYRRKLMSGPYTFVFDVPELGESVFNQLVLEVEALDTYGASNNDPDLHIATEKLIVTIKEDEPPIVNIAAPLNSKEYFEGEHILVQINAIDDIAIDTVGLAVDGLITGPQNLIASRAPYEFLLKVPYGQKGKSISFTATATEKRYSGTPRLATSQTVNVVINEDSSIPEISVIAPIQNAVISEKGSLEYYIEATDNVEVGNLLLNFYADKDLDGSLSDLELIAQKYLFSAPYSGRIQLDTIDSYTGENLNVDSLPMALEVIASDGANNKNQKRIQFSLRANSKPVVDNIQLMDSNGELQSHFEEITRGRDFVINVLASDAEKGINKITLLRAINAQNDSDYVVVGTDSAAPFQFDQNAESLVVGSTVSYRAIATDQDGYESVLSTAKTFTIVADKAPEVTIIKPVNEQSHIISGNSIEVFAEVVDDLGVKGIDRVVFLMDDLPIATVSEAYKGDGLSGVNNWYKATLFPAVDASGVAIQVVAYDKLNQAGFSQVIKLGVVEDTIEPEIVSVTPTSGDLLSGGETQLASVIIKDIGSISQRQVLQEWIREYQDNSGIWHSLASVEKELTYDDNRANELGLELGNPNHHSYLYWAEFSDGRILSHENKRAERVRIITRVVTNKHEVELETLHEVSLPISEHRFWLPSDGAKIEGRSSPKDSAKQVYYSNLSQYGSIEEIQSLSGSWSTHSSLDILQNFSLYESNKSFDSDKTPKAYTGLFLADFYDQQQPAEEGERYIFSDLVNGSAEIFRGTITGIKSQNNLVLAVKSGDICEVCTGPSDFTHYLNKEIEEFPETGNVYDDRQAELLLFNKRNADEQFGIPYLLAGKVDLPYNDAYSIEAAGNLALVANGAGGVQVINIAELGSPYHVGFIKPDGFVRDVKVKGQYAFITASYQGLVVADLSRPQMPVIATLDTAGIANRLKIVGNKAYVTDMGEWDGAGALHIIDIEDPTNIHIEKTYVIRPGREDYISAGAYDVEVVGGKAYVSTYYIDQEGTPIEGVVEIIELEQIGLEHIDPSRSVITHRPTTESDHLATDIALANGRVQIASGKRGIAEIDFPTLTIIEHSPKAETNNLGVFALDIAVHFSAAITESIEWQEYFTVTQGHPDIGLDITHQFDINFKELADGVLSTRVVEAKLKSEYQLQPDSHYFVRVKAGVKPVTGYLLPEDYLFSFTTISALSEKVPEFISITPAQGDVAGGTEIIIEGRNFDEGIQLELGGFPLAISQLELAETEDALDTIKATTIPNYPGPAALRLINPGVVDLFVPGAFTYVDELRISFVSPPFVSVSQQGQNDLVTLVGHGFSPNIRLKAYRADGKGREVIQFVDGDRLTLYSAEKLDWRVPDFGDNFRGFVDIEITDQRGRIAILSKALFYGGLVVDRTLETQEPLSIDEIKEYNSGERGALLDPVKLPAGGIVDLANDSELSLVYVLGKGINDKDVKSESEIFEAEYVTTYYAPGWISLVHYDRDNLNHAAPMHGLGYYDLPQAVVPAALALGEQHIYISAQGRNFPYIDMDFESFSYLFVMDRVLALPGENEVPVNRGILATISLPFDNAAKQILIKDNLLLAHSGNRIAVIDISSPAKPFVLKTWDNVSLKGQQVPLSIEALSVRENQMWLTIKSASGKNTVSVVYDLSQPSLPILAVNSLSGPNALTPLSAKMVNSHEQVSYWDLAQLDKAKRQLIFNGFGFTLPGDVMAITTSETIATQALEEVVIDPKERPSEYRTHLPVYDLSDTGQIRLHDVVTLCDIGCVPGPILQTDDGLSLLSLASTFYNNKLSLIDLHTIDIRTVSPLPNEQAVSLDSSINIVFTGNVNFAGEAVDSFMAKYMSLVREDGTDSGEIVAVDFEWNQVNPNEFIIKPKQNLQPLQRYRVLLKEEPLSYRTQGLLNYSYSFTTASAINTPFEIETVIPHSLSTQGGETVVSFSSVVQSPDFYVAGKAAQVIEVLAGGTSYRILVPSNESGAAMLTVVSQGGANAKKLGAINYVEALQLTSVKPEIGSVAGGDKIQIIGQGFEPGIERLSINFEGVTVNSNDIQVIDAETISVITPSGALGKADITVKYDDGRIATLRDGFEYRMPSSFEVQGKGKIYETLLDPSQNYLFAAAGKDGIYLRDLSKAQAGEDSLVGHYSLPHGYAALGLAGYFEQSNDRIFVTAAKLNSSGNPEPESAALFILAIDSIDISQFTLVNQLELGSEFAKGLFVENQSAVIAMANKGVGLVDTYQHSKLYLSASASLSAEHQALDVTTINLSDTKSHYVVAAGEFDFSLNTLKNQEVNSGGVYLYSNSALDGLSEISHINIPASHVVTQDTYAYASSGDLGLSIIDFSNAEAPVLINRIDEYGHVYDIAISGHVLYIALGEQGVKALDISDPNNVIELDGFVDHGRNVEVLVTTDYAILGVSNYGDTVQPLYSIGSYNDIALKIISVEPKSKILSPDSTMQTQVHLRFNKAVDLWEENAQKVEIKRTDNSAVSSDITVTNNDILAKFSTVELADGEKLFVNVKPGIKSVKPLASGGSITLYETKKPSSFAFNFLPEQLDNLKLHHVLPRRVLINDQKLMSLTLSGLPKKYDDFSLYLGGQLAEIQQVSQGEDNDALFLVEFTSPIIKQAGLYDLVAELSINGVEISAKLLGAVAVDAILKTDFSRPLWTDVKGSELIDLWGEGFEPGSSLAGGTQVWVGSAPANHVEVLSTNHLRFSAPANPTGTKSIRVTSRGAQFSQSNLMLGYGLKALGKTQVSQTAPSQILVDKQSGVAIGASGLFSQPGYPNQSIFNSPIPDKTIVFSADINDPYSPLIVGGRGSISNNDQDMEDLYEQILIN
ncbi:Ig-like domain-containing protein, partial [Shewanella sp. 10N.286.52.B9]|uniref:Ig-like domain-containing protein n=1 Tax=Shewanella sp. 10N.286.52.B9 TaxID=1880837 RepID=UPI0018E45CCC